MPSSFDVLWTHGIHGVSIIIAQTFEIHFAIQLSALVKRMTEKLKGERSLATPKQNGRERHGKNTTKRISPCLLLSMYWGLMEYMGYPTILLKRSRSIVQSNFQHKWSGRQKNKRESVLSLDLSKTDGKVMEKRRPREFLCAFFFRCLVDSSVTWGIQHYCSYV